MIYKEILYLYCLKCGQNKGQSDRILCLTHLTAAKSWGWSLKIYYLSNHLIHLSCVCTIVHILWTINENILYLYCLKNVVRIRARFLAIWQLSGPEADHWKFTTCQTLTPQLYALGISLSWLYTCTLFNIFHFLIIFSWLGYHFVIHL